MKLVLHVGMGKTGSSAIQQSLELNRAELEQQRARYLGMWFGSLDARFSGLIKQYDFFYSPPDKMREHGEHFLSKLKEVNQQEGIETFVMSNESFWEQAGRLYPFIESIRSGAEIRLVGYVRNPISWLPSAYAQWGIVDKVDKGQVPTYRHKALELMDRYNAAFMWRDLMAESFLIRHYDLVADVPDDFADIAGLLLPKHAPRQYERRNTGELILRALFNGRFAEPVLPDVFDAAVFPSGRTFTRLSELIKQSFDYSETKDIIKERKWVLDRYKDVFNIDLIGGDLKPLPVPELPAIRAELLEYAIDVMLLQSQKIEALSRRVAEIEKR